MAQHDHARRLATTGLVTASLVRLRRAMYREQKYCARTVVALRQPTAPSLWAGTLFARTNSAAGVAIPVRHPLPNSSESALERHSCGSACLEMPSASGVVSSSGRWRPNGVLKGTCHVKSNMLPLLAFAACGRRTSRFRTRSGPYSRTKRAGMLCWNRSRRSVACEARHR